MNTSITDGEGERIAEYRRFEKLAGLTAGRTLGTSGEFRLGVLRGTGEFTREIGDATLPDLDYDIGEYYATTIVDTSDSPDFPTSGVSLNLSYLQSLEDLGANEEFDQITGAANLPLTWGRSTLVLGNSFGATLTERPIERYFSLGGFLDLSGYARNSLSASDYMVSRAVYTYRFSELKLPLVGFGFFAGGSVELGRLTSDFENLPDPGTIAAGSALLGLDTPLIPMYFAVGLAEEGELAGYFILGRIGARRR